MALTKAAKDGLRWVKDGSGKKPPYDIYRALIESGYITPAGALTPKGEAEVERGD